MCTLFPELNAPPKEKEDRPITHVPKKPPGKSLFLIPMSPDPEENVDDDSDTDLQVSVRVLEKCPTKVPCRVITKEGTN